MTLSGGWGGYAGFIGTVGLVFNNFSLRKASTLAQLDAGARRRRPAPGPERAGQRLAVPGLLALLYGALAGRPSATTRSRSA
ncbi:MAG: hypothetical protein WKG07_33370 [Hymenobacter sp.]